MKLLVSLDSLSMEYTGVRGYREKHIMIKYCTVHVLLSSYFRILEHRHVLRMREPPRTNRFEI